MLFPIKMSDVLFKSSDEIVLELEKDNCVKIKPSKEEPA